MKATIPWLGSALVAVLIASTARAQCPPGGRGIPQAPDGCGPGYYAPNEYGLWFGPNYDVYPPWRPFNGARPPLPGKGAAAGPATAQPYGPYGPQAAAGAGPRMVPYPNGGGGGYGQEVPGPASFPTHPWARSPRDFFMEDAPDYYGVSAPSPRPYLPTAPFPAPLTPQVEIPR